jgi:glutathione S-transferase
MAKVDEVLYTLQEIDTLLAPSGKETDADKKKKLRQELASGPISTLFGHLQQLQASNGGEWFVGGSITISDLAAYCKLNSFVRGAYDDIPKDILNGFPGLMALYARVEAHPKVAAWNDAHK